MAFTYFDSSQEIQKKMLIALLSFHFNFITPTQKKKDSPLRGIFFFS